MNHSNTKQPLSENEKIEQLQIDIGQIKMRMDKEYIQKLNDQNNPIYNIFLLGPSGSGKSTMANELIDVRIVFQSEDEETFDCTSQQNKKMIFKISENSMKSETDMPQEYRVEQYQLWDLPGYFDCRCKYKDLKNIVSSQSLIQKSEYSQILIVIPASQFYDYKLEKLIKILNNIDKNNSEISLSLVISMVNGQKLDYFLKKLNDLLKSNILTTGRELLLQILVQNRVILFECPKQDPNNEDAYYFCQKNIQQIQQQVFQTDRFKKHDQLKLNPPDETKIILQEIYKKSTTEIQSSQEKLNKQTLRLLILSLISYKDEQIQGLINLQDDYQKQDASLVKSIKRYEFFHEIFQSKDFSNICDYQNQKKQKELQIQNIFKVFDDVMLNQDYYYANKKNNILYIKCMHLNATQLLKIISKFYGIDQVLICTLIAFNLDQDLLLPGVSIYLKTNYFISNPNKKLCINLKGKDGQEFQPPKAGQSKINPQHGEEGQVGYDGGNGGHLQIEAQIFYYDVRKLTLDVSGGNGGKGQDGGDGKNGKNGDDAEKINEKNRKQHKILEQHEVGQTFLENYGTFSNTYLRLYQSKGTPGQKGGNAGKGGLGGIGGKAGSVKLNQQDGSFGPNGQDGQPGNGGQIGRTFERKYKAIKAFGALREHENIKETQGVGQRIGVNVATLGVGTVASVFGTAVKAILNHNEWLNDGEYKAEEIYSEKGIINQGINQRSNKLKTNPEIQQKEIQEFVKTTYEKWNANPWIQQIQESIQDELNKQ